MNEKLFYFIIFPAALFCLFSNSRSRSKLLVQTMPTSGFNHHTERDEYLEQMQIVLRPEYSNIQYLFILLHIFAYLYIISYVYISEKRISFFPAEDAEGCEWCLLPGNRMMSLPVINGGCWESVWVFEHCDAPSGQEHNHHFPSSSSSSSSCSLTLHTFRKFL